MGSTATVLVSGLIVAGLASTIADRLGAPPRVIGVAETVLMCAAVILAGVLSRTMRPSVFEIAGGRMGRVRSSALIFCGAMALVIWQSGAERILPAATSVAAALLFAAVIFAAPMRQAGATSLGQFALARYRSRTLCILAGIATIGFSLWAAGLAVDAALRGYLIVDEAAALPATFSSIGPLLLILGLSWIGMTLPGGAASLAAAGVLIGLAVIAAYGLPVAVLASRADPALAMAVQQVAALSAQPVIHDQVAVLAFGLAVFSGVTGLAKSGDRARQSLASAALAVLIAGAVVATVLTASNIATSALVGRTIDQLPPQIYDKNTRDLVTICGAAPVDPTELGRRCVGRLDAGRLPQREIAIRQNTSRWFAVSLNLPAIEGALLGVAQLFVALLALGLAARAGASALVDDVLYVVIQREGTASARLALKRLLILAVPPFAVVALHFAAREISAAPQWVMSAVLALMLAIPIALVVPARFRADWRAPALVLAIAACVAGGVALDGQLALFCVILSVAAALVGLALRTDDPRDRRAAEIIAGCSDGPIAQERGA